MAAVEGVESRTLSPHRAKPTQARPRHSLFGTALENVKKSEIEGISLTEVRTVGQGRQEPERYPIPEHLQGELSARAMVQKAISDISIQNQSLVEAQQQLKEKELKALAFKSEADGKPQPRRQKPSWLTKQDLEHSEEINIVGLNKHGSYDRDRYGAKPPTHNYSLIGDFLSKGNEFGRMQKYEPDPALLALNESENNNLEKIRLGMNPKVDPDVEKPLKPRSAVQLPPNIRHQFGSRVCDALLSDEKKVTETMEKQKRSGRSAKARLEVDTKDYEAKASGSYFDVGHVTRYNVFPGHSMPTMDSTTKATHSDVVYLRRGPMPNEYRVIKDGYAIWAEQNLVREKMKKQWNAPKT
ncbi:hypothetical protein V1264_012921 [Littorina saxatilis]|uniref:Uncharacterized protein n=1 Tax=Littorina saxatilis TaxID=31220 RepID=A0AAN9GM25_9CAEN